MSWVDDRLIVGGRDEIYGGDDKLRKNVDLVIDVRPWFCCKGLECWPRPKLSRYADLLVELANRGYVMFIHCAHGVDRSPFVAAVYYAKRNNVSLEEAYNHIVSVRPLVCRHNEWILYIHDPLDGSRSHMNAKSGDREAKPTYIQTKEGTMGPFLLGLTKTFAKGGDPKSRQLLDELGIRY